MLGILRSCVRRAQWLSAPKAWMTRRQRITIVMLLFITIVLSTTAYFMVDSIQTPAFHAITSVFPGSLVKSNEHSGTPSIANSLRTPVPDSVAVNVQNQTHKPDKNTDTDDVKNDEIEKEFKKQWFRMQKYRVDWKRIMAPCANNTVLGQTLPGWGKENETSLKESYVEYMEVRPAGQFSRFFVRTRTAEGRNKTIGGDFWKVILFGPATVAATVFDHGNGSYEAIALIVDPGKYSLVAIVERSLCEGALDPSPEFFRRLMMRIKMKSSKLNTMGIEPGCCLSGRLPKVDFNVVPSNDNVEERIEAVLKSSCATSCSFIWTGLGRFIEREWTPFLSSDNHHLNSLSKKTQQTKDTIFLYGGSVTAQFATDYFKRKAYNVCDQVFKRCRIDYLQLYPTKSKLHPNGFTYFEYNELKKYGNTTQEFKPKLIIDSLKEVFREPGMDRRDSVLVLNLNVQFARLLTFAEFKDLITNVTYLLKNKEKLLGRKARVVWRTGTALNYRGFRKEWGSKFFTSHRILLFGAYALSEMCKAGIDILDWYPMSMATPLARDRVHFQPGTFFKAMDALTWYSLAGVYPRTEKMCLVPS